ncbi:MAG: ChbG/HpnK family deacetylase [Bacteroidota bacterium]|nr:ChbG/HpnK family deacetylase [Bacteroidota bacterium]
MTAIHNKQERKPGIKELRYQYLIRLMGSMIIIFSFPTFLSAQKLNLELKWTTNQKCFLESSATVADIDNNGSDEAIVASQEELIAVGKSGNSLWRWKARGRFMTYPAVLKRAGELALIYAADYTGQLTCLNGNGKVVWQADLNAGSEWSASVVADLDGNGSFEIIQTDLKKTVWIFDALTGKLNRKTSLSGGLLVSPAVGDLTGDGRSEIAIASNDGSITVLRSDLSELWKYKIGGFSETWSTSAPVMFSASDGKNYLVAASGTGEVFCFDAQGKPVWQYPTNVPVSSSISVGDFDQDGQTDIFLITQTGLIYRFDEHGNVIWKIDMQGRSLAPGAIADINNDGKSEYVLSTQNGHVLVLNNVGEVIFDYQLPSRTINVTPSIGNITGNPDKLDLFLTGGEAGLTYCFETPGTKKSSIQWSNYRGNAQNTGSWFGLIQSDELRMVPQNLAWNKLLTGERVQFNISNPKPVSNPLKAAAICISPDGAKHNAIANIQGKEGQLLLPVDFTLPGIYKFSWTLTTNDGKELLSSSREVSLQAFENDRALAKLSVSALNTSADKVEEILPLSANALRNEAFQLQATDQAVSAQQQMVPVSEAGTVQATVKNTAKLNEQSKRALLISEIVRKAASLGSETSLIAFEGSKWENRNVDQQLPTKVENPVLISHAAVPGEHQPVPLVLFNVTDHLLNVRVVTENPDKEIKVTAMRSINTATSLGEESWDALPEIDESGVISIPSLSSREVWLDLKIDEAKPGKHDLEITLQALNGAGVLDAPTNPHAVPAPETKVKISLDVLPFKMAPSGDFRLCTWSPSTGPEVESLLAHGNNVFLLAQPKFKFNDKNELVGFDYSDFDQIIAQFKGHDVFFLVSGLPAISDEFASEAYKKQLSFYLKDLVNHLASKGIDIDHFSLYPIDEPGGNGWKAINTLVQFGEMAAAVNPDVMLYQDGGGELPMFEAMAKCVDVWVAPFDWVADQSPEMNVMRTTGKLLWSYNCSYSSSRPIGPNIKNINLIYEYRTAALLALRNGGSGIGFWCYNSVSENPWSRMKMEYNLVYTGKTKSVTSRRWEAVREGIEDYRILAALKEYLKPDAKVDDNVRNKIEHLLKTSLPNLVDPGSQAMKLGQSREVFDLVCSDSKMDAFRNEMISCIQSITAANTKNWAEKLGFQKGKKVLLLHIDDAGMCPEANAATEKYIEKGDLTSAAVMMPCVNAEAMIAWANKHPLADIGAHLTLTSEWQNYRWGPVSDPAKIPGLVDPFGKFYHEVPEVVMHASAKEVEVEIRAQIEKSIALGHRPTHIDTHMGTLYGSPEYVKVFLKVAEEYHIPGNIIDLSDPQVASFFRKAGYPITDEVISNVGEYRLPKLDNFSSVPEGKTYEEKRGNFFNLVKSLNPGLTEIIFHPAALSENLKSITGTWQQRVWESELFADPVVKQFFMDEGIVITNWKEIMKRFDAKK